MISVVAVQSFRVLPSDSEVVEGSSVILRCEVDNQEGDVQWAKDGFVLGEYIHPFRYPLLKSLQLSVLPKLNPDLFHLFK